MDNSSISAQKSNLPSPLTVPWTPRDVVWALVMSVLLIFIFFFLAALSQRVGLAIDSSVALVFGTSVLLIPAWYFSIYKYRVAWADLGLRGFHPRALGTGLGLLALSWLFIMVYGFILALFDQQIQPDIDLIFEDTTFPLILLFGGGVVAPFVEELFFRGFVFPGLRNQWGWRKGAMVSAGLFALAHIVPTSYLPIFILGFIFAFLYQTSDSIWPSILMHMIFNSVNLALVFAASQGLISMP